MKRVFYEWCGLACAALALACIAAWAISRGTTNSSFELSFGYRMQMIAAKGGVTFCDHPANLEVIELVKNSKSFEPAPSKIHAWCIPGFHLDYLGFANGPPIWSVHLSLLVPSAIFLMIGVFCVHRYRMIRRHKSVPLSDVT